MRHFILPRPVAARSLSMFNPATMARLVAPPRCMQRPPACVWPTISAVDMAPIAIAAEGLAADDRGRNRRSRHALADGVDARRRDCDDAPAIVPLHGVGHGAEAKLPGDGSAPCLPSQSRKVYRITLKYPVTRPSSGVPSRIAQVGPQEPPAPSLRCARRALRFGAGPSDGLPGQSGAPKRSTAI